MRNISHNQDAHEIYIFMFDENVKDNLKKCYVDFNYAQSSLKKYFMRF